MVRIWPSWPAAAGESPCIQRPLQAPPGREVEVQEQRHHDEARSPASGARARRRRQSRRAPRAACRSRSAAGPAMLAQTQGKKRPNTPRHRARRGRRLELAGGRPQHDIGEEHAADPDDRRRGCARQVRQSWLFQRGCHQARPSIRSEAFSPIMMQAALVLPDTTVGMIEASATRRPCDPVHLERGVDHAVRPARRSHRAGAGGMEDRAAARAGVGQHVVVADAVRAGLDLLGDVGLERRGLCEAAGQLQARDGADAIGLGGEIVGDDRRVVRAGRAT